MWGINISPSESPAMDLRESFGELGGELFGAIGEEALLIFKDADLEAKKLVMCMWYDLR